MKTACPLCNNTAFIKHTVLSYKYYFCSTCTTLFIYPAPSEKVTRNYYQKDFSYSAGFVNEKLIRNRSKVILNKLVQLNPKGSKLLDIGSGYGFFLDEAEKKGLNVTGVEPSKELISFKSNYNVAIINDQFPTTKLKNEKFDFVTLIHVIEHLVDPLEIIKHALSHLKNGGILYIETPNLDSHLYRFENDRYTFLTPPDHIFLFSRFSFKHMLLNIGTIRKINTYSYPQHLMGIVKQMVKKTKQYDMTVTNQHPSNFQNKASFTKRLKYVLFDTILARILYPLLNLNQQGSILELYISK